MASRAVVVGVALTALIIRASLLHAQDDAPRTGHRLHIVRATDGTAVAGAEVFDVDGSPEGFKLTWGIRIENADQQMPKVAPRLVADGDGYVTVGPGRLHRMLVRAPGLHHWIELTDLDHKGSETIELYRDLPLVIELVDGHGKPVGGAFVELGEMMMCGNGSRWNLPWRAASDRDGRVFYPHYVSRVADQDLVSGEWLELQNPVADPKRHDLRAYHDLPTAEFLEEGPPVLRWQLPPLAKIRVEFTDVEALPAERALTFDLVGPNWMLGEPDRYASDHGKPVEVLTETGVPLRAWFHWGERDRDRGIEPDLLVYGSAHPIEGGSALLRVPVASDLVDVRLRPVRGDGAAFPASASAATAAAKVRKFDVSLQWFDRAGFRLVRNVFGVAPDETGTLRFTWPRPRLDAADRPAKLRVALRDDFHLYGWELLEPDDLVSREVDWPLGGALDVGTLTVPGSG
jgi:hypothetical protein